MNEKSTLSAPAAASAAYSFGELYIAGHWRSGRAGTKLKINDPYNGEMLAEIADANVPDVEEAFQAATDAQREWAQAMPVARADVMRRVAQLMENRREEIVRWLIREAGSTRIKAEMEWGTVRSIVLESSTLPSRLQGRIRGDALEQRVSGARPAHAHVDFVDHYRRTGIDVDGDLPFSMA